MISRSEYTLEYTAEATKDLATLSQTMAQRVLDRLDWLVTNPTAILDPRRRLSGLLAGKFKLRLGDYRVIYTVDHAQQIVRVESIKHRSRVYKRSY